MELYQTCVYKLGENSVGFQLQADVKCAVKDLTLSDPLNFFFTPNPLLKNRGLRMKTSFIVHLLSGTYGLVIIIHHMM